MLQTQINKELRNNKVARQGRLRSRLPSEEEGRQQVPSPQSDQDKIDEGTDQGIQLRHQRASFRQVSILKSLDHPNIIKFENSFCDDENLYIVMEYAERGDLYNLIKVKKQCRSEFTEQEIWKMATDLISALHYLHGKLIIHRDIKTLNVFITSNGTLKLGDLGVSKILNEENMEQTRIGTPLYLAPQLIKHEIYDFKADVWGLGVILYLVATLEHPFTGKNIISLGQSIVRDNPRALPSKFSGSLKKLIFQLLEKDPKRRPSCEYLLKNYLELSEKKTKTNKDILECKSLKDFKEKTQSTKEQDIATNRMRREVKYSPPRPIIDFQPTGNQQLPKAKKVDNFIETYKAIPSQRKKRIVHNIQQFIEIPQLTKPTQTVKNIVPEIAKPPQVQIVPIKPSPIAEQKKQFPSTPQPKQKQFDDFGVMTPSSVVLSSKVNRRPMSAVVCKISDPKKTSCSITLRDLLSVKNNTQQKNRLISHEAEPFAPPIKVEWLDEPTPMNRVRPSSGTVVGRYYKVKPNPSEKSTVLSRSFTKPKCPTIELIRPQVVIMDFCRKIDF